MDLWKTSENRFGITVNKKNLTLKQVAEKAECSDAFISQVERSLASPSIATRKRIANAL